VLDGEAVVPPVDEVLLPVPLVYVPLPEEHA
jgi:hypothetical protein